MVKTVIIYFRNTGTGGNSLFGQIDTIDCFTRLATSSSIYKIQNSAGTNKLTLDASGNLSLSGECNIASGNTYKINGTIFYQVVPSQVQLLTVH